VSSTFCSNPDAFGVDNTEKDIFDSLKNITQLPPSPSKGEDRQDDSVIRTAESPTIEEVVGEKSPIASTGELSLRDHRLVFDGFC
jgi:hypothetical protein